MTRSTALALTTADGDATEEVARIFCGAITRSGVRLKAIAKATGRSVHRLSHYRTARYRLPVADLLRLPDEVQRDVLSRVAELCGCELVEPVPAEDVQGVTMVQRLIRRTAHELIESLEDVRAEGYLTAGKAAAIGETARRLRRLATAVEVFCARAQRERVIGVGDP